jgi:hypothetical protein
MDAPLPKSDPREESGRMNGIVMGIIYIAVFVPGSGDCATRHSFAGSKFISSEYRNHIVLHFA